jgi:hypothetical protein
MSDSGIDVKGLAEFDASMQRLSSSLPEVATQVSITAAGMVITSARPTVPTRTGRAASSLQVYVTGSIGTAGGGEGLAYYRWLELGGAAGRNLSVVRPKSEGRYISPAYDREQAAIQAVMEQSLAQACKDSGLEVT